jgi:predicted naringenin-chalcone synthase
MSLAILGLGTALPRYPFAQKDAAEVIQSFFCETDEQRRLLPILFRRAGVRQRHSVLVERPAGNGPIQSFYPPASCPEDRGPTTAQRMEIYRKESAPLALPAARQALDQAGILPRDLTHVITVSCTGFTAPGLDIGLIKGLGLKPTISRLHVGFMGCHGVFNALQAASSIVSAEPHARILICAVELSSLHLHYGWDPDSIVPHALFADGAAALVAADHRMERLGPEVNGNMKTTPFEESGRATQLWQATALGSCLFSDSEHAMTWNIGDHGFVMTLSADVPDLIQRNLRSWLEGWLRRNDLQIKDVPSWAIHPGGPRILSAVAESLDLPQEVLEDSQAVLADCGNMSSPTILFILERLRRRNAPCPCVALSFGPGLIAEAAVFR